MDGSEYVTVSLTSVSQSLQPGETYVVGVKMSLALGWHIYWKNPGDAGEPPSLKWTLPEGFKVYKTYWPVPHRIDAGGVISYGYEGDPTLLVQLSVPSTYKAGTKVPYKLDIGFLVCNELCLPGSASLSGDLSAITAKQDPVALRKSLPTLAPGDNFTLVQKDGTATLAFEVQNLDAKNIKSVYFFSAQSPVIDHAAPQKWRLDGTKLIVEAKVSKYAQAQIKKPEGVLVIVLTDRTLAIEYFNANSGGT